MKKEVTIMIVGFLMMVGGWSALFGLKEHWALISLVVGLVGFFILMRGFCLLILSPKDTPQDNKLSRVTDPWIETPKVKKTEKKNKPLPEIWKDKVLTSN